MNINIYNLKWIKGDWEFFQKLDSDLSCNKDESVQLDHFIASALFQCGEYERAGKYVNKALVHGASRNEMVKLLLSGASNSLGKAALILDIKEKAKNNIQQALNIYNNDLDGELLYSARFTTQLIKINKYKANKIHADQKKEYRLSKEEKVKFIKDKLERAKKLRAEAMYFEAGLNILQILEIEPNQVNALKESARIKSAQSQWNAAIEDYSRILKTQTETESAILARSLMKKNSGFLEEAIYDMEHARALGFYNSQMAHQLALAYRDNQQWEEAEQTVRDLLIQDPFYLHTLSFANFVADLLRKRKKVQEACVLLSTSVEQAQADGKEIPLNTQAILQELQYAAGQPEYMQEVSRHYYDAIYAHSEKYQADPEHSVYLPVWEKVVDILKQEGAQRVLDIGCGPGQFAEYLLHQIPGIKYQGVDYSQTAIEKAQLRCPTAQFYVKDLMHTDVFNEFEADAYVVLEVLEHVVNDIELLEKIPKHVKIIMSVPNFDALGHVRFFLTGDDVYERYSGSIKFEHLTIIKIKKSSNLYLVNGVRR